jgi:hypothetical protein
MTIPEIRALEGEALRIAVAEAEGWRWSMPDEAYFFRGSLYGSVKELPAYEKKRDLITEAILRRFTTDVEMCRFSIELMKLVNGKHLVFTIATASAADLSRAFLIALNPTENTK